MSVQSSKEPRAREEAVLRGFSVEMPVREAAEGGAEAGRAVRPQRRLAWVTIERRKVCAAPREVMASHGITVTLQRGSQEGTPALLSHRQGAACRGRGLSAQWVLRAGRSHGPRQLRSG